VASQLFSESFQTVFQTSARKVEYVWVPVFWEQGWEAPLFSKENSIKSFSFNWGSPLLSGPADSVAPHLLSFSGEKAPNSIKERNSHLVGKEILGAGGMAQVVECLLVYSPLSQQDPVQELVSFSTESMTATPSAFKIFGPSTCGSHVQYYLNRRQRSEEAGANSF
jgi:hypothetical protein